MKTFPQVAKIVSTQQSWVSSLFIENSAFSLAHELGDFLITNPLVEDEFPFLRESPDPFANFALLHYSLLVSRLLEDSSSDSKNLASGITHVAKTEIFIPLSQKINPDIPAQDFSSSILENYANRLELIDNEIHSYEKSNALEQNQEIKDEEFTVRFI